MRAMLPARSLTAVWLFWVSCMLMVLVGAMNTKKETLRRDKNMGKKNRKYRRERAVETFQADR